MNHILVSAAKRIGYTVAALIIIAAMLVSASRLLAPLLDKHRPDFETWASQLLKADVSIGRARLTWYRYEPGVSLIEVTVLDKNSKEPILQVKKVSLFFSLSQSLWQRKPVLSGVMVSGTSVKFLEAKDGSISLVGFPSLGGFQDQPYKHETKATDVMAWLSSGPRLILRDIDIRYTGATDQKRFVTLYNLNFVNDGNVHRADGKAVLHQKIPTEITVAGQWEGDQFDPTKIKAKGYVYVSGLLLSQWFTGFSWHGWSVQDGLGSSKVWLEWRDGAFNKIQSEVQLYNLKLYSANDKSTHSINRISGNVGWKQNGKTEVIAGDDILVDLPQHLWPATDFYLELNQNANHELMPRTFSIGYVDINDVKAFTLSSAALLPDNLRKMLDALNPTGSLQNIKLTFNDALNPERIDVDTQFTQLSFSPWQALPGIKKLSGGIAWNSLNGQLSLQADNSDITIAVDGTLALSKETAPIANIKGNFVVKDARHITSYLPVAIFDKKLVGWLNQAFLSGRAEAGKIILRGPLADYPFDKGTGEFTISGQVKDIDLRYAPDWPVLEKVSGNLAFSGRRMDVDVDHAVLSGMPIHAVHAEIPYLGDDKPQFLTVTTTPIQADFSQGLQFVRASPLNKTLGKMFTGMAITGPMTLTLGLSLPLSNPDDTTVKGTIIIHDAEFNLVPWNLVLHKMTGNVSFTENTTTAKSITGEIFGKPLNLSLTTLKKTKNTPSIVKAGVATQIDMADLDAWLKLPVKKIANGAINVAGNVDLSLDAPIVVRLNSNLVGVAIDLPNPYGKKAADKRAFSTEITAANNKSLQIKLHYGPSLSLQISPSAKDWAMMISSPEMTGRLTLPANLSKQGMVTANFDYLNIPARDQKEASAAIDARTLPAISFVANRVQYANTQLGKVSFQTSPTASGLVIRSLTVSSPSLDMHATGEWTQINDHPKTHLQGDATSSNVSNLLSSWGFDAHNAVLGKGKFNFNVNWAGPAFSPSLQSMNGKASLDLGQGRIVEIGAGNGAKMDLGRMLNIFSLETIPRRLSLDFSDMFQKGYSFDSLRGDLSFEDGDLYTTNTRFDGPVARIGISGRIGLAEKDYDLTLSVMPYVTASIPVAATLITGQPVIGLAALVFNKVLTPAVSTVTTYYYTVRGPWSAPIWNKSIKPA